MKKGINLKLLSETIKLFTKYKKTEWEELLEFLRDGENIEHLINLANIAKELDLRTKGNKKRVKTSIERTSTPISKQLSELRESDPEKYNLIQEIRNAAFGKQILNTMDQIKNYANFCGIKGITSSTKRASAINSILRHLMTLETEEIKSSLSKATTTSNTYGKDFENWVRIIVGEKHSSD